MFFVHISKMIKILVQISMKAITILRYMTDNVDVLPLGVTTRLVVTHDTPVLFIQLLEEKPWIKTSRDGNNIQVFEGSEWMVSKLMRIELNNRE